MADQVYTVMANQGYRRTNFEEDEYASAGGTPTSIDFPPAQVVFKGGAGLSSNGLRGLWSKRTTLENCLIIAVGLLILIVIIMAAVLASKDTRVQELKGETDKYCTTPRCVNIASTLLTSMDSSIDPCEDFFHYACGGWIKANPIPTGHSRWNTFEVMTQKNLLVMKNAIDKPLKNFTSEAVRKASKYYTSCMDPDDLVEKAGAKPLIDLIAGLGWGVNLTEWDYTWQLPSGWTYHKMLEDAQMRNIGSLFSLFVSEDDKNSSANVLQIDQGGLMFLGRDSYINKTVDDDKILKGYLNYMKEVYRLLGAPNETYTEERAREVILFEAELANISLPEEERRDENKNYHKHSCRFIVRQWSDINWLHLINHLLSTVNLEINLDEQIVVYAPDFLTQLNSLLKEHMKTEKGKRMLYNYFLWQVVGKYSGLLSKPFRDAQTTFTEIVSGQQGTDYAWHMCIQETDLYVGYALGSLFVKETFKGGSKEKSEKMVENVRHAFMSNLKTLPWMDARTKSAALDKAISMHDMIGFPDYILDDAKLDEKYKELKMNESDYFGNNLRAQDFSLFKSFEKLRKRPLKTEWSMTPPTVNAYYKPNDNTMVFPAGVLQVPFFDVNNPKSLNYGAMGVVMGHELTHGFDDQGRQFDKYGNLNQWWKNSSIAQFKKKAKCFVDQYSSYTLHGEHVRGKQTLGENIADNGGIKSAYNAYSGWVEKNGKEKLLPGLGLTHKQMFFLSFAQVWCVNSQKEHDHLLLTTDSHSPSKFRVIGTLSNSREFADAYKCNPGSAMNPVKKCQIW